MQRIYKVHFIHLIVLWVLGVSMWWWVFLKVAEYYPFGITGELFRLIIEQSNVVSVVGIIFLFLIPAGLTLYTIHWRRYHDTHTHTHTHKSTI